MDVDLLELKREFFQSQRWADIEPEDWLFEDGGPSPLYDGEGKLID
jgi:hypothetical protein